MLFEKVIQMQESESDFQMQKNWGEICMKLTNTPKDKRVESSHVSEVVEFGDVCKHVVEVVRIRRILTLCPPSIKQISRLSSL